MSNYPHLVAPDGTVTELATPVAIGAVDPIAAAAAALAAPELSADITAEVMPQPDSRLDQLLAQYDLAKAEADKADEALKAITDGIKSELANAAPGATTIDVASPHLARPLRLKAIESWRVDTKSLKERYPLAYAHCAKASTSYRLARVG